MSCLPQVGLPRDEDVLAGRCCLECAAPGKRIGCGIGAGPPVGSAAKGNDDLLIDLHNALVEEICASMGE